MRWEVVARKAALYKLRKQFTVVAGRLQGALGGRCIPLCRCRIQLAACSWEPAPPASRGGASKDPEKCARRAKDLAGKDRGLNSGP